MNLMRMIRQRYAGESWMVVEEVSNGTGYQKVTRRADAVAFGLWPSRGFEVHGLEIKVQRADVIRELRDIEKADAVGQYCDHWWLVVSELALIDGLVIPATWGVLVPKNGVLRVHRKAPKRDAKPLDRAFVASLVRKGLANTVSKNLHEDFKEEAREKLRKEIEAERHLDGFSNKRELTALRDMVATFEKAAGISLASHWEAGDIGAAVKIVREMRELAGASRNSHWRLDVEALVDMEIAGLEARAERAEKATETFRDVVKQLRAFAGRTPSIPMLPEDPIAPAEEASAWAQQMSRGAAGVE